MSYHRHANLDTIYSTVLEARHSFADIVSPATDFTNGAGPTVTIGLPGGDSVRAMPTRRAHGQLAGRANVPIAYYDRIAAGHQELWEHTMNTLYPDTPSLFRLRYPADGGLPVLRAALSDRYQVIDNVDVLSTVLKAFADSGLGTNDVQIDGDLDVDDGSLRVRCTVPSIAINALDLVRDYRSPFNGRSGTDLPMMFGGIEFSNSETGGGAYSIGPRAVLQVCTNGMTRDVANFRRVHLGARLQHDGLITWSEETRTKQLELIGSAAGDAIRTFLSPGFLVTMRDDALRAQGKAVVDVTESHASIVKLASLSDDEARAALNAFTQSGAMTQLGWAHAITAVAQNVESSDRQNELESTFWSIVNANQLAGVS